MADNDVNWIVNLNDDEDSDDSIDKYFDDNEINYEKDSIEQEDIIIGIDLGTTNSCVGIWRNNKLEIIPDEFGNKTIPSVVSFTNLSKFVGREGKNQLDINSENSFYEVKRLIGRKFSDISVQNDIPLLSYKIISNEIESIILKGNLTKRKTKYTPEEISAHILIKLKHMAEIYLKRKVTRAVITVPAYFNDGQRQATKDAAKIAGLNAVRILNEPTSAALAYGFQNQSLFKQDTDINIIVCDIGGGTTDVSLLNINNGIFDVLGSAGNSHLGGADFDNAIIKYCKLIFRKKNNIKKFDGITSLSLQNLRKACENAKKWLTTNEKAVIAVRNFYNDKDLFVTLSRDKFYSICKDLFILCIKPINDVIQSSELDIDDIDEIILVGGATRMPLIQQNIKNYFRGKNPNLNVNPDEVVAAGAAIQAYMLSNKTDPFTENVVLLDVLPLSLGVETIGGVMDTLIDRNTTIPTKRKKRYTTDSDYESSVTIKIYEGERQLTKDNFFVGQFDLTGLYKAPRGYADIEVEFAVDVNGIIDIVAIDKKNKENKNSITVTGNKGRMSIEEIAELISEAENMELKDKMNRVKKQYYYEIEDLCSCIKINMDREDCQMKNSDRNIILDDIGKVLEWLKKKSYFDRDKREYEKIVKKIKNRYGTLILKIDEDKNKFKPQNNKNVEATNIFDDDEKDIEETFVKIDDENLKMGDNIDEEEKKRLKNKRKYLLDLCYSVHEIISSGKLKIKSEHQDEIIDLINDLLLWSHVREKITEAEYDSKARMLNMACDKLFSSYDSDVFENNDSDIVTDKDELEELCYVLKTSFQNDMIQCKNKEKVDNLDKLLDETLDFILEINIKISEAELTGETYEYDNKLIISKKERINAICDELNNEVLKTDIINDTIITEEFDFENIIKNKDNSGTSLIDL